MILIRYVTSGALVNMIAMGITLLLTKLIPTMTQREILIVSALAVMPLSYAVTSKSVFNKEINNKVVFSKFTIVYLMNISIYSVITLGLENLMPGETFVPKSTLAIFLGAGLTFFVHKNWTYK
ncbi:MAG: hypothetical protein EBU96_03850 [Actinobacteria bacterium]|nr:hypothetical protein [Actinomycetota bacterium]